MDMIDILGGILGQKMSQPGKGTDVLNDIFGRGRSGSRSSIPTEDEIARQSEALEEMLNVAKDRNSAGRGSQSGTASAYPPTGSSARHDSGYRPTQPAPPRAPAPPQPPATPRSPAPPRSPAESQSESGDRAMVLIRAMINAAKADGQVDQTEQQNILQRLNDRSPETIAFLQQEFARPVNLGEFARSVPVGMEQQVYMLSLITIDLNTAGEAKYLMELGDALRISPEARNQIHQRVGAPSLY